MASSGQYRMDLIWASHGEQLRADIARTQGSLTGFDKTVRGHSRQLGIWGQEMKAIGTTLRYALAGSLLYGTVTAVGALGQLEDRLGEISALAAELQSGGKLVGLGDALAEVGDEMMRISDQYGIAVDDIGQHMARFYSSFDVPERQRGLEQMKEWTDAMAQMTLVAEGGDPQAMSAGIAGLLLGTGRAQRFEDIGPNARDMVDVIYEVTRRSPVITGADISRDVGRLTAAATAMNMSPEEIFAVYGQASRAGGAGAVIGRGVTQLLSAEILEPQTKEQKTAFQRMGLPTDPNQLRGFQFEGFQGGMAVLMKMMTAVGGTVTNPMGLIGVTEGMSPEAVAATAGVRGMDVNLAAQAFGRMESFRQFLNLMATGGVPALKEFVEGIKESERTNRGAQAAEIRREERDIIRATNAFRNIRTRVLRGAESGIDVIGGGVERGAALSRDLGPGGSLLAVGGALGTAALFRMLLGGRLPAGLGGRLRGIPGLGRLFGAAPQLAAASVVGAGPGIFTSTGMGSERAGARNNPLWVVIDPLSWGMPGAPTGTALGPGGGPVPVPGGRSRWWRWGLPLGASLALASTPLIAQAAMDEDIDRSMDSGARNVNANRYPLLARFTRRTKGTGISFTEGRSDAEQRILSAYTRHYISAQTAEARLRRLDQGTARGRNVAGTGLGFVQQIQGEAGVTITLQATPELRRAILDINRKEHVPVRLWDQSLTGQPPTLRGQPKTQRRGSTGGR